MNIARRGFSFGGGKPRIKAKSINKFSPGPGQYRAEDNSIKVTR